MYTSVRGNDRSVAYMFRLVANVLNPDVKSERWCIILVNSTYLGCFPLPQCLANSDLLALASCHQFTCVVHNIPKIFQNVIPTLQDGKYFCLKHNFAILRIEDCKLLWGLGMQFAFHVYLVVSLLMASVVKCLNCFWRYQ